MDVSEPDPHAEAAKHQVEAEIAHLKGVVEDATIEEVDVPDGRKDVEIAFSNAEQGFQHLEGTAIGVYFEPGRLNPHEVHIDWLQSPAGSDEEGRPQGRTSVKWENIDTFEESDYYMEGEE